MLAMFPLEENNIVNIHSLDLNFSTQNVRSLNISSKNIITEQKILAIVRGGHDIIFLSDLRLNSRIQHVACKELIKSFYLHGYKFIHNSTVSSRGVGILINRKVLDNIIIHSVNRDLNCNYMLLDIEFKGERYTIGSIYGVNSNEGISMYTDLERDLRAFKNTKIILGGDWNATWCLDEVERNIDVLNMANVPSSRRSRAIRNMCENLGVTDPYRIFYPETREYTFTPSGLNQLNCSRLDFFLVSKNLCDKIVNVVIPHSLSSTTFDHKNVNLIFSKKKGNFKFFVKDTYLDNDEFKCTVHLAVVECYIQHATINNEFSDRIKDDILTRIGTITVNLRELNLLKLNEAENGANPRLTLEIEGKLGEIKANLDELPNLEYLDNLSLDPDPAIFMETLILCIKNNALLEQQRLSKLGNTKQNSLITEIKNFKRENYGNVNAAIIQRKERELSVLIELGLKKELENFIDHFG